MRFLDILKRPSRLLMLVLGVFLVGFSVFHPLSQYSPVTFFQSNYLDLVLENLGWITIVASLREFFWGVKKEDFPKFIPLVTIFFVIIFVYTIARQLKDAVVIPDLGIEGAIAAKIFVFIFSLLYQKYYTSVTRNFEPKRWALFAIVPIVAYFSIFSLFLVDKPSLLPSPETVARWKQAFPVLMDKSKVADLIALWPNVLYYIMAEIYAVTVTIVFFWQLANRYVTKEERPRFYMSMMIIAQISALDTGLISKALCRMGSAKTVIMSINGIIFVLSMVLFIANSYFFKAVAKMEPGEIHKKKSDEPKQGIVEMIRKHPVFLFAALLTVFYGLSLIFVEQVWKDKVKLLSGKRAIELGIDKKVAYASLNSTFITFQSRVSIIIALGISSIIKRFPWLIMACITPAILLIGSIAIFGPFVFPGLMKILAPGIDPVTISYAGGFLVLAFFKALKYNCFDISKENYISTKTDSQKREIKNLEGYFGRVGKSGASVISFFISRGFGWSFSSPQMCLTLFIMVTGIGLVWVYANIQLNNDLKKNEDHN